MTGKLAKLVEIFNHNLKVIKRELDSSTVATLAKKYRADSDGHLAKILAIRGIRL